MILTDRSLLSQSYQHIRLIGFEISIHEIENGQPKGGECR